MSEKDKNEETKSHINEILSTYRVEDKRGVFKANDLSFRVLPVDGTETIPFYALINVAQKMANAEGRVNTSLLLVGLFTDVDEKGAKKRPIQKRLKIKFCEMFYKDYRRYERYAYGKQLAKWIEKLVLLDKTNKPVRYYDLEKKYLLSKEDIAKLLIYICELSGFM